jgi:glycolate oxidase FAD binding subunit
VQAAPEHGPALRALAARAGGSACVFVAAGAQGESAKAVFDDKSTALAAIHQRLRQAFDPAGIFNPGRAVP